MNFKKKVNGSWVDTPNYIHKTDTDTFTTLPAVLYPTGSIATVGLKGDMEQSSQPSPQTPIQPQECGDRTGNLCNNIPYKRNYYINENGVETSYNGFDIYKVSAIANTTYTLSLNVSLSGSQVRIHTYSNGSWIEQTAIVNAQSLPATFTTPNNCDEIRFSINYAALDHIMLNSGSTALPYEPYDIKIPILSANTTTPVYLGEVESTRKIKKLVLTGEEDGWVTNSIITSGNAFYNASLFTGYKPSTGGVCTHYKTVTSKSATEGVYWGVNINIITSFADGIDTALKWKQYLAQQYAAGTPVCVWYVLATPETAVVNEPIRKIGDYADEVSGITIPTIAGANTISVDTTLQPSEVTVNYKGWHPVADVHERESGAWD